MTTTPPHTSSPASAGPGPRCRACGADIAPDAERCPRCGTAQRMDACPHCGATAGVTVDRELRYRCDACGGPRIPPPPRGGARSGLEAPALRRAQTALSARVRWRAAAVASGLLLGFNVLLIGLFLLITGASLWVLLAGLFTVVPLAGFTFWAYTRAKARSREVAPALDAAWVAAATEIAARTKDALTARGLAASLGLEEAQAEELLALLEVNDVVRGAVGADGEIAYASRVRIGPSVDGAIPGAAAGADPGALVAAEQEALAAEEAAAEIRRRTADVDPPKK